MFINRWMDKEDVAHGYNGILLSHKKEWNNAICGNLNGPQFSSVTQSCSTLCNPMDYSMLGFLVHHQLLELAQTHVHLQPYHPLLSPSPPTFNLSQHQVSSNESVLCIRWSKYWSFRFSISFSNEYSVLISLRMDWFDLHAVQGTLKSLLQHHSSKAINTSVLSLLYSPTLTSTHDYWKNHSFD